MATTKSTTNEVRAPSKEGFYAFFQTLEKKRFKGWVQWSDELVDVRPLTAYDIIDVFRDASCGTLYWSELYRK